MNPLKSMKRELSDTIAHFKDLGKVAKEKGIFEALKLDYVATRLRNYSSAQWMADQEKTRKIRLVPVGIEHNVDTGKTYNVIGERNVTNADYGAMWSNW